MEILNVKIVEILLGYIISKEKDETVYGFISN